jgi:uncharacterized membrane protein YciS (DUF1049 family)
MDQQQAHAVFFILAALIGGFFWLMEEKNKLERRLSILNRDLEELSAKLSRMD